MAPSLINQKRMGDSSKTSERDAEGERVELNYDEETSKGEKAVKVICLGDSAVGKSKLVERYLVDGFTPQRLSTYGTKADLQIMLEISLIKTDFYQPRSGMV